MQTLLNFLGHTTPAEASALIDDGRDKWVGLVSALGLCALALNDLVSML